LDIYVKNKDLLKALLKYRETKSKKDYNILGTMFLKIAQRILYMPNFVNYSEDIKENAISDACFYMCKYMKNFDETKQKYPNPFSYFSEIARQAMVLNINKFHKKEERQLSLDFIDNFNENGVGDNSTQYKVNSEIFESESKLLEGF